MSSRADARRQGWTKQKLGDAVEYICKAAKRERWHADRVDILAKLSGSREAGCPWEQAIFWQKSRTGEVRAGGFDIEIDFCRKIGDAQKAYSWKQAASVLCNGGELKRQSTNGKSKADSRNVTLEHRGFGNCSEYDIGNAVEVAVDPFFPQSDDRAGLICRMAGVICCAKLLKVESNGLLVEYSDRKKEVVQRHFVRREPEVKPPCVGQMAEVYFGDLSGYPPGYWDVMVDSVDEQKQVYSVTYDDTYTHEVPESRMRLLDIGDMGTHTSGAAAASSTTAADDDDGGMSYGGFDRLGDDDDDDDEEDNIDYNEEDNIDYNEEDDGSPASTRAPARSPPEVNEEEAEAEHLDEDEVIAQAEAKVAAAADAADAAAEAAAAAAETTAAAAAAVAAHKERLAKKQRELDALKAVQAAKKECETVADKLKRQGEEVIEAQKKVEKAKQCVSNLTVQAQDAQNTLADKARAVKRSADAVKRLMAMAELWSEVNQAAGLQYPEAGEARAAARGMSELANAAEEAERQRSLVQRATTDAENAEGLVQLNLLWLCLSQRHLPSCEAKVKAAQESVASARVQLQDAERKHAEDLQAVQSRPSLPPGQPSSGASPAVPPRPYVVVRAPEMNQPAPGEALAAARKALAARAAQRASSGGSSSSDDMYISTEMEIEHIREKIDKDHRKRYELIVYDSWKKASEEIILRTQLPQHHPNWMRRPAVLHLMGHGAGQKLLRTGAETGAPGDVRLPPRYIRAACVKSHGTLR